MVVRLLGRFGSLGSFVPWAVDEGMTCGSSIFAYLVFGPGRASTEGIARPMKMIA
jgi:hypothetical protein